ncbi:MAG: cytochrome c [Azospirillaceae bacterium]
MPDRRWVGAGVLAAVLAIAAAGGWWTIAGRAAPVPDLDDPDLIALGETVYVAECAACHGAGLEGETPDWRERKANGRLPAPPHDETGHTWHHPDRQLFELTMYGVEPFAPDGYESDMPAFEGRLSDREIWASLAFIRSRWPERIIRAREERGE